MEFSEVIRRIVSDEMMKVLSSMSQDSDINSMPDLLTRNEVADILGVSLPTLHSYVSKGYLKAHKIGKKTVRFHKRDVLASLESFDKSAKGHKGEPKTKWQMILKIFEENPKANQTEVAKIVGVSREYVNRVCNTRGAINA
jgi:excisionase family DNA binding protein